MSPSLFYLFLTDNYDSKILTPSLSWALHVTIVKDLMLNTKAPLSVAKRFMHTCKVHFKTVSLIALPAEADTLRPLHLNTKEVLMLELNIFDVGSLHFKR